MSSTPSDVARDLIVAAIESEQMALPSEPDKAAEVLGVMYRTVVLAIDGANSEVSAAARQRSNY